MSAWHVPLAVLAAVLFAGFLLIVFRGAPYVPTHKKRAQAALDLLDVPPGSTIVDLGSGDGVVLKLAARRGLRAIGYELNPVLCAVAYVRCWRYRDRVSIFWRDFWRTPLPPHTDAVFVFLAGPYMKKFARKIAQEMSGRQRGLYVISYGFAIPGRQPSRAEGEIYLYKLAPGRPK